MKRVHVVGCPRSGTTLLHALCAHGFAIDLAGAHEDPLWREPPRTCRVWLTKQPRDLRLAARMLALDPGLWIVEISRDPRSVVTSVHAAHPGRYFVDLAVWFECEHAARALATHPRFVRVRYEDLVRDPERVQQELARSFAYLTPRATFSSFGRDAAVDDPDALRALGGVRPIDAAHVDAWRAHLPRVAGQMAACAGLETALVERGDERDASWTNCLRGVTPDLRPGVRRGSPRVLRKLERDLREHFLWRAKRKAVAARGNA